VRATPHHFASFQFEVIFFDIIEAVTLVGRQALRISGVWPISPRLQFPVDGINHKNPRHSI
jgi:hypothetical protein